MHTETLYPPHIQRLSDNVIGEVIQRSRSRHRDQVFALRRTSKAHASNVQRPLSLAQTSALVTSGSMTNPELAKLNKSPATKNLVPAKRDHDSTLNSAKQSTGHRHRTRTALLRDTVPAHKLTAELLKTFVEDEDFRREQRRLQQQRYRKKINNHAISLGDAVQGLQEAVHELELRHQRLVTQSLTATTPWNVVVEYFRLFRHGSTIPVQTKHSKNSKPTLTPPSAHIQNNFLLSVMAPDVSVNSGFGLEALLKEWRSAPAFRSGITVLLQLEYDEKAAMVATIKSCTTITKDILRREFSHLLDSDEQLGPLATKLLDEKLIIPATVRFVWDATTGRVANMHFTPDFVTPFLTLLGGLEEVSRALSGLDLSFANCTRI